MIIQSNNPNSSHYRSRQVFVVGVSLIIAFIFWSLTLLSLLVNVQYISMVNSILPIELLPIELSESWDSIIDFIQKISITSFLVLNLVTPVISFVEFHPRDLGILLGIGMIICFMIFLLSIVLGAMYLFFSFSMSRTHADNVIRAVSNSTGIASIALLSLGSIASTIWGKIAWDRSAGLSRSKMRGILLNLLLFLGVYLAGISSFILVR